MLFAACCNITFVGEVMAKHGGYHAGLFGQPLDAEPGGVFDPAHYGDHADVAREWFELGRRHRRQPPH